jgi:hypothetical protein
LNAHHRRLSQSHETANHGPPFTSINRTLFQQYRRLAVVLKADSNDPYPPERP